MWRRGQRRGQFHSPKRNMQKASSFVFVYDVIQMVPPTLTSVLSVDGNSTHLEQLVITFCQNKFSVLEFPDASMIGKDWQWPTRLRAGLFIIHFRMHLL